MQRELPFVMKFTVQDEAFNEHVNNSQVPKGKQHWKKLFLPVASSRVLTLVFGDGQNEECAESHHGEDWEEDPDEEEEPQPF